MNSNSKRSLKSTTVALLTLFSIVASVEAIAQVEVNKDDVLKNIPNAMICEVYRDADLSHRDFGQAAFSIEKTSDLLVESKSSSEPRLNFKIGGSSTPRRRINPADLKCEYFYLYKDGAYGFVHACNDLEAPSPLQTAPTASFLFNPDRKSGSICNGSASAGKCWSFRNCR